MFNINKIKRGVVTCCAVLVALLLFVSLISFGSLAIYAAKDDEEKKESQDHSNETISEDGGNAEKQEKEQKAEDKEEDKPEPKKENAAPEWKSDTSEFVLEGKTIIDLSEYFYDENNDHLAYLFTEPENIKVEVDGSIITLTPKGHNFTSSISFTAADGEKAATKEIKLIVPEKSISIVLEYDHDEGYDTDNDGYETTTGVIDFTVENSKFSWNADEANLCTKWELESIEDGKSTTVCYGSSKCCNFLSLEPSRENWDEPFYSVYGQYGATNNNIVSAQVVYADYSLDIDDPFASIYFSPWKSMAARYYSLFIEFRNVCVDTCFLSDFNLTSYKLIFEISGAVMNLELIAYSIAEEIANVLVNLEIKDREGTDSGSYQLYKNGALIKEQFVEPGYYDAEIVPKENIIGKLAIGDINITKPLSSTIGIDRIEANVSIENLNIRKKYAINLEGLDFAKAVLTANATSNSLYKCRLWDFYSETCFGSWEMVKNLVEGEKYEVALSPEDQAFVEGNLEISEIVFTVGIHGIKIQLNGNETIDLGRHFLNLDAETSLTYYSQGNVTIGFSGGAATIRPEIDYAGISYAYITASKGNAVASSNLFLINVTNSTESAAITNETILALIAGIQNITISKGSNATLNLSNYFSGIDSALFGYLIQDNVSIVFGGNTATVIPSPEFIGTVYTYIIANKSGNIVLSNLFSINTIEIVQELTFTNLTFNITDPVIQQKLRNYAEINLKHVFRYNSVEFTSYEIVNEVVIVYMAVDGKSLRWLTSSRNFGDILR